MQISLPAPPCKYLVHSPCTHLFLSMKSFCCGPTFVMHERNTHANTRNIHWKTHCAGHQCLISAAPVLAGHGRRNMPGGGTCQVATHVLRSWGICTTQLDNLGCPGTPCSSCAVLTEYSTTSQSQAPSSARETKMNAQIGTMEVHTNIH